MRGARAMLFCHPSCQRLHHLVRLFVLSNRVAHAQLQLPLTRTRLDRRYIVISHVVLDPRPVGIVVSLRPGVGMELLGEGTVSEKTGRDGDLEAQPVLRMANIEDISCVGRACWWLLGNG